MSDRLDSLAQGENFVFKNRCQNGASSASAKFARKEKKESLPSPLTMKACMQPSTTLFTYLGRKKNSPD